VFLALSKKQDFIEKSFFRWNGRVATESKSPRSTDGQETWTVQYNFPILKKYLWFLDNKGHGFISFGTFNSEVKQIKYENYIPIKESWYKRINFIKSLEKLKIIFKLLEELWKIKD